MRWSIAHLRHCRDWAAPPPSRARAATRGVDPDKHTSRTPSQSHVRRRALTPASRRTGRGCLFPRTMRIQCTLAGSQRRRDLPSILHLLSARVSPPPPVTHTSLRKRDCLFGFSASCGRAVALHPHRLCHITRSRSSATVKVNSNTRTEREEHVRSCARVSRTPHVLLRCFPPPSPSPCIESFVRSGTREHKCIQYRILTSNCRD